MTFLTRTRHMVTFILLAVLSLSGLSVIALGADPEADPVGASQETSASETGALPAEEDAPSKQDKEQDEVPEGPSPEVFVPTEDISEDYAVAFPVDI